MAGDTVTTPPTRPQGYLDDAYTVTKGQRRQYEDEEADLASVPWIVGAVLDPLTVEPLDDRVPHHPKPYRLVAAGPRRGCSFRGCAWLVILTALALFWALVAAALVAVWR